MKFFVEKCSKKMFCYKSITAHYWFLVPFSFAKLLGKQSSLFGKIIVWRHRKAKTRQNDAFQKIHFAYLILTSFFLFTAVFQSSSINNFAQYFPVKMNEWNFNEFFNEFYLSFLNVSKVGSQSWVCVCGFYSKV